MSFIWKLADTEIDPSQITITPSSIIMQELYKKKIKELKEELLYWKKYKHLEFDKLEEDEDYWDCVVMEHNLKHYKDYGLDDPRTAYVYGEGKEEYDKFCKYFPRPLEN